MNKDLVIGILVSLSLHLGVLGWEKMFPKGKVITHAVKTDDTPQMQMVAPPEEPPEPDKTQDINDDEPVQNVMAPPSLVDMPTVVPMDAFTQQITPPPPPGLTTDTHAVTIPVIRQTNTFGKGIADLFNPADLDQQVQVRIPVQPKYPPEMKRQGITGVVLLECIVNSNGDVVDARVLKSPSHEFDAPSLAAIVKWKFRPGKKGGRAVNVRVQQPLEFTLKED